MVRLEDTLGPHTVCCGALAVDVGSKDFASPLSGHPSEQNGQNGTQETQQGLEDNHVNPHAKHGNAQHQAVVLPKQGNSGCIITDLLHIYLVMHIAHHRLFMPVQATRPSAKPSKQHMTCQRCEETPGRGRENYGGTLHECA